MLVVYTTDGKYVGFYVGKSNDIGRRWRDHLQNWFIEPHHTMDTGFRSTPMTF